MSRWVPAAIVFLFLLAALSGCLDDDSTEDPPEEPAAPTQRMLADLQECQGTYPGSDTPIRCENELETFVPLADPPQEDWSCIAQSDPEQPQGIRLYHNESDEGYTLHYWTPHDVPVLGILAFGGEDEEDLEYLEWDEGPRNGSIPLETLEPGDEVHLLLFRVLVYTDTPELVNATVRVDWSWHDERPYPVRVLVTEDEEYYVHQTQPVNDEVFPHQWGNVVDHYGADMVIHGPDYAARLEHYEHLRESLTALEPDEADC